jgi:hypothetical protein
MAMGIINVERASFKCVAKIEDFFDWPKEILQIFTSLRYLWIEVADPFNHPVGPGGEMAAPDGQGVAVSPVRIDV